MLWIVRSNTKAVLLSLVKQSVIQSRLFYAVKHNEKRETFYVKLTESSRAVLQYKLDGKIMDMRSVTVPSEYKGQGLARLLAETAFTYAIVNNYFMYLTCDYLKKYYLAVKNHDLEERIVGPPEILDGAASVKIDPDDIYELPDPEDFVI